MSRRALSVRSSSGVVGVRWVNRTRNHWQAYLNKKHIGYFPTLPEAQRARQAAEAAAEPAKAPRKRVHRIKLTITLAEPVSRQALLAYVAMAVGTQCGCHPYRYAPSADGAYEDNDEVLCGEVKVVTTDGGPSWSRA